MIYPLKRYHCTFSTTFDLRYRSSHSAITMSMTEPANLPVHLLLLFRWADGSGRDLSALLGVTKSIQPRPSGGPSGLELFDFCSVLEGESDVVETVDETVSSEVINVERDRTLSVGSVDDLVFEVDFELLSGRGVGVQDLELVLREYKRQHTILETVVVEDIGKRRCENTSDAKVVERPWGVFSTGTTTKVATGVDEDLGVPEWLLVEDKVGVLLAGLGVVSSFKEGGLAETRSLKSLEELLGDDHVGIDVGN
jgi:hypothetical protein